MDDIAIRVEGLGKRFRLRHQVGGPRYRTFREDLLGMPRRLLNGLRGKGGEQEEFWALKDVSFEVKQGEVLGIIGRNGAGKSTLLKVLSRIMDPTCGEATVHGRIGSLLEVGTGFHPELTGRENIFLSGALLGMKRDEVRRRFDEIVAFAGVEKFLDTPCKHYSSGMYTRLGFAVAANLDTEILLLDEVLAVGDAEFRERCRRKMQDVVNSDQRTIVLVSHDLALIRGLCTRVILLEDGGARMSGPPAEVLQAYHHSQERNVALIAEEILHAHSSVTIRSVRVGGRETLDVPLPGDRTYLNVEVAGTLACEVPMALEVRLLNADGDVLAMFSPGHLTGRVRRYPAGPFVLNERIRMPRLLQGDFFLRIALTDPNRTCWCEFKPTVRLEAEGVPTTMGGLKAGSHCGAILLDESPPEEADR